MEISSYTCVRKPPPLGHSSFAGITGLGANSPNEPADDPSAGLFAYNRRTTFGAVVDGLSNTLAVADSQANTGFWSRGGPSTVRYLDPQRQPYLGFPRGQFGLEEGALVLFGDASVRMLPPQTNPSVFERMATMADGQAWPPDK